MANKKFKDPRIIIDDERVITRKGLFKKKEEFHREQAKLPFEEKIKILLQLQKIAESIQRPQKSERSIWKIF